MTISSSTPQGWSDHCPICNAEFRIEPSAMFGDATCANCGSLLWFLHLEPQLRVYEHSSSRRIRDRVIAFIAAQLGIDPKELAEKTFPFEDLGTDSLDTVELVIKLEQEIKGFGGPTDRT